MTRVAVLVFACVAGVLGACGSGSVARPRSAEVPQAASPDASTANDHGDGLPTLRDLVLRGPGVAPGMRILAQGDATPPATIALPTADVDLCVRVIFAAGHPVRAKLETVEEGQLAEIGPADAGVLGLRGPVCVRKGRTVTFTIDEGAPHARYVVWGAP